MKLMIGDWVLSKSDDKIYKINSIITQDDGTILLATEDGLHFDYMYEPIPLTAEILEKNGFTRLGTSYILKGEHFGLNNPSNPSNYLDNYWLRISIKAVNIEYVHQLQHALRLCGIEKEVLCESSALAVERNINLKP